MRPQIVKALLIGVAASATAQSQMAGVATPVSRYRTILIAEFKEVNYPAGPPELAAVIQTRVRINRIIRDEHSLGLKPTECDVTIRRPTVLVGAGNANWWAGREVRAGQRYIFFSDAKSDLPELIAEPASGEEVMDGIDSVGDIELILNSPKLPVFDQVQNALLVLKDSQQHSYHLAQYVAALLDAGSEVETLPLVELISGGGDSAFSERAKESLLFSLYDHSRSPLARVPPLPGEPPGPPNDNLIRVFASLVVRYFGEMPTQPSSPANRLQRMTLEHFSLFLRTSDQALRVFRRLLMAASTKIQNAALRCISDKRLTEKEKNEARELMRLLEN